MLSRFSAFLRCDVALDLGTAVTRLALAGEGVVLEEPSVVAVSRGNNRILAGGCAVGHIARQMLGRTPDSVSVVRPLAAGVITDFHLCQAMLRYFLRKVRPGRFGLRPRLLIAVPGSLTQVEKRTIFLTAHRAGASRVQLLSVAQAAALGSALPIAEPVANMIIDIGAGATEVAMLSLGDVVAKQSDPDRRRPDGSNSRRLAPPQSGPPHRTHHGRAAPHQSRHRLRRRRCSQRRSSRPRCRHRFAAKTRNQLRPNPPRLAEPLEKLLETIRATVDQCSPDLVADLVDRGMVICGGGALLRGLDLWLSERTGIPARVAAEPTLTVVHGTLKCLEHLDAWQSLIETSDEAIQ